jgi:pyruvate formate-lyase activating enzyme-like uncharacterized protein
MIEVEVASRRVTNSSEEPDDERSSEEREFQRVAVTHLTVSAPLPAREVPLVPETEEGFTQFQTLASALLGVSKNEINDAEENLRSLREEGDELRERHDSDVD